MTETELSERIAELLTDTDAVHQKEKADVVIAELV